MGTGIHVVESKQRLAVQDMDIKHQVASVGVALCTTAAAHRRDHHHATGAECCHPHAVEVIQLGDRGVAVCHDCESDSGFLPRREAERLAAEHQHDTLSVTAAGKIFAAA